MGRLDSFTRASAAHERDGTTWYPQLRRRKAIGRFLDASSERTLLIGSAGRANAHGTSGEDAGVMATGQALADGFSAMKPISLRCEHIVIRQAVAVDAGEQVERESASQLTPEPPEIDPCSRGCI